MGDGDHRVAGSDDLITEISSHFALGRVSSWRDLGGSRTTNLWLCCDRRHLVARVHRKSTTNARLRAEQDARTVLAHAGVRTVMPLADRTGQTCRALHNGRLVEVEPFVPSTRQMNSPTLLLAGFSELARIHDILRRADLPPAARHVEQANYISVGGAAPATRQGAQRIRSWGDRRLAEFASAAVYLVAEVTAAERFLLQEQVVQVVHGDYWDNNVLFTRHSIAAVLDFGFMNERARVDDLALPFWFYLHQPGHGYPTAADQELLRRLVEAYDDAAAMPLSDAELASIPLSIARQPAWSFGGWVLNLPEPQAVRHARAAAAELPVAQAIMADLPGWQKVLTKRSKH